MVRYALMLAALVAVGVAGGLVAPDAGAHGGKDGHAPKTNEAEPLYKFHCAECHGEKGAGDGPQRAKLKTKPTDWTAGGGGLKGLADQQIADWIVKGGKAMGKTPAMPGHRDFPPEAVQNLVKYVKSLIK